MTRLQSRFIYVFAKTINGVFFFCSFDLGKRTGWILLYRGTIPIQFDQQVTVNRNSKTLILSPFWYNTCVAASGHRFSSRGRAPWSGDCRSCWRVARTTSARRWRRWPNAVPDRRDAPPGSAGRPRRSYQRVPWTIACASDVTSGASGLCRFRATLMNSHIVAVWGFELYMDILLTRSLIWSRRVLSSWL